MRPSGRREIPARHLTDVEFEGHGLYIWRASNPVGKATNPVSKWAWAHAPITCPAASINTGFVRNLLLSFERNIRTPDGTVRVASAPSSPDRSIETTLWNTGPRN